MNRKFLKKTNSVPRITKIVKKKEKIEEKKEDIRTSFLKTPEPKVVFQIQDSDDEMPEVLELNKVERKAPKTEVKPRSKPKRLETKKPRIERRGRPKKAAIKAKKNHTIMSYFKKS
mmetsp:Transcript_24253/g.21531  ORF Transcript_24253/g.21531 Transcript_24253/m.21531 type:complete len:116 (+) Transcript_24253:324-671(+)